MTVYDVLNRIDKDLIGCEQNIKRSRRQNTMLHLVKATERKKALQEIKEYILANH